MVHILDIFVSIAMSTILFLAGCSDKAVKDNEGNGGSDNEGDEPVETEYLQLYPVMQFGTECNWNDHSCLGERSVLFCLSYGSHRRR